MKRLEKWQELVYAIGGAGPGLLYQVVLTYLLYYYRPAQERVSVGAVILAPAAGYAAGMLIARALNGVVEIYLRQPLAWTIPPSIRAQVELYAPLFIVGVITGVAGGLVTLVYSGNEFVRSAKG